MNFIQSAQNIIRENTPSLDKAIALCDTLIPKLMYISLREATGVQLVTSDFAKQLPQPSLSYYLYHTCAAYLEYRQMHFKKALEMADKIRRETQEVVEEGQRMINYVLSGLNYRSLGEVQNALLFFNKALQIEIGHVRWLKSEYFLHGIALYQTSELYGVLKQYEKMLKRQHELLAFAEEGNNVDLINRAWNGIGRAYFGLKNYPEALRHLKIADEKSRRAGNMQFITRNLHDLGDINAEMGTYKAALRYYKMALEERQRSRVTDAVVSSLLSIGKTYIALAKYDDAITSLFEALEIAETLEVKGKIYQIYEQLAMAHKKNEAPVLAQLFYEKYQTIKAEVSVEK